MGLVLLLVMLTVKASTLRGWDGQCGGAAAFSAALRSTRTCLALGWCSVVCDEGAVAVL